MSTLHHLLIEAARLSPERPALRDREGELTYAALLECVRARAASWHQAGLRQGDIVPVLLPRGRNATIAFYALSWLGCPYAPIDPIWPIRRVAKAIDTLNPRAWVAPAQLVDELVKASLGWSPPELHLSPLGEERCPPPPSLQPEAPAYILFTSGSTGVPKGVVHSHKSAMAFISWAHEVTGLGSSDRVAGHASPSFDLSILDIFVSCAAHACLYPLSEAIRFRGKLLGRFLREHGITTMYAVPAVWIALLEELESDAPPQLVNALYAGEVFPLPQLRRLRDALPCARLLNFYGPTETNVVCWHELTREDLSKPDASRIIGQAVEGTTLTLDSAGPGSGSEALLWSEGPTTMLGYHGEAPHRGPYNTGDLVRTNDPRGIVFVGRADTQVKVRGHRIELSEVELCCQGVPGVDAATALVIEEDANGASIVVFVTPDSSDIDLLMKACRATLPAPAVPSAVYALSAFPLTSNGKVDRSALATQPPPS